MHALLGGGASSYPRSSASSAPLFSSDAGPASTPRRAVRPDHHRVGQFRTNHIDRPLYRRGHDVDFPKACKRTVERVLDWKAPQHVNLLGLARATRLPNPAERLVLAVIPYQARPTWQ